MINNEMSNNNNEINNNNNNNNDDDEMNEAEYLMKNYGDRPRRITPSEISIILHMIRKPNSIIVLLFIQNNS